VVLHVGVRLAVAIESDDFLIVRAYHQQGRAGMGELGDVLSDQFKHSLDAVGLQQLPRRGQQCAHLGQFKPGFGVVVHRWIACHVHGSPGGDGVIASDTDCPALCRRRASGSAITRAMTASGTPIWRM
jgi:hypothetical protein